MLRGQPELLSTGSICVLFVLQDSNLEATLAQCPQTIGEKTHKLLLAIHRRTNHFGQELYLKLEEDYPLAYAKNSKEAWAFLTYLCERGFVKTLGTSGGYETVLTAPGFEAVESRLLSPPITVFISSTSYDLVDVHAELVDFLEGKGFIVKVSDDPYHFDVEPTEDSIQTCLRNVDAADVIICILDGRYGPPLPPEKELSATHVEVRHARKLERPVYIFGRDKALAEYDLLRRNPGASTLWVEKHDDDQRKRWVAFVRELSELAAAQAEGHSNWVDPFQTSVQLKKLVLKRLGEYQRRRLIEQNKPG